jgi:hypothetical protein
LNCLSLPFNVVVLYGRTIAARFEEIDYAFET